MINVFSIDISTMHNRNIIRAEVIITIISIEISSKIKNQQNYIRIIKTLRNLNVYNM